jgi:ferritin
MTQLNLNAYLLIEDRLDAIGQRYRVLRLLRGLLLFVGAAVVTSVILGVVAHLIGSATGGHSKWLWLVMIAWCAGLVATFILWVIKPLMLRPRAIEMARLVESRVEGLHNTLTNSLLLQNAKDLSNNPYLPAIFNENLRNVQNKPLDEAVKFSDLRRLSIVVACIVVAFLALFIIPNFRAALTHGWQQMFHPATFVPVVGETEILEIQPGDITLVTGQPLEVIVITKSTDRKSIPPAKLIFDNRNKPIDLTGSQAADGRVRYAYRAEHIDASTRYRVEAGGTQSKWFAVTVVKQVTMQSLALTITPPLYTRQPRQNLTLKPADINKAIAVPQGSTIEFTATLDVPVRSAMLQVADATPMAMEARQQGRQFAGQTHLMEDAAISILLSEGAGQIIARLPEEALNIHVTRDAAPIIEMKWPTQDTAVAPDAEIKVQATLTDDYGITAARVLLATTADGPLATAEKFTYSDVTTRKDLQVALKLPGEIRKHGHSIRVQIETTDNRDLQSVIAGVKGIASLEDGTPQTTTSSIYEIKFRDFEQIKREEKEQSDKLRQALLELLKTQNALLSTTAAWKPKELPSMAKIHTGQSDLRARMTQIAETFTFEPKTKVIQKTLQVLVHNPASEAVDLSAAIASEKVEKESLKLAQSLMGKQRRIISTLESLLAFLNHGPEVASPANLKNGGDIPGQKEALEKLNEALKQFMKEEQRILDQTAQLAKKPVDQYDDADKKLLDDLLMAQEKMDAFIQAKVNDVSKLAEQDMSNAALLKELMEVYSEVTMAKNALNDKATEIAVSAEEMGQELAKDLSSNIEKWLGNKPDRQQWKQEDPLTKSDIPMAELPRELEDMVGELMEDQEDLFDEMEDMDANWADSADKGAGWDAADGPIANMSAKGVTGNQQPNDNNMNGRSGEGRSGKSQGEMVEDTASGKGGRPTPTRLDPTPFARGQIKDQSKDPTGGATGGGKLSGQGGQGLEGPVGPKQKAEMQRLASKQAQIRNQAERLNLKYQLGRYDNFQMLQAIAMMRRTESDLKANRYQMAMRRKDMTLDTLDTSHLLLGGQIHVRQDTTPTTSTKLEEQINDAMRGDLPAAWSDALKEYYKKLSME